MEVKKSWKGAVPVISALIGLIIGILIMFFSTGCVSFPERGKDEPQICFQNRSCIFGVIKTGSKDMAGCTASFALSCKKIIIMEYCEGKFPDSSENQSSCREKLN